KLGNGLVVPAGSVSLGEWDQAAAVEALWSRDVRKVAQGCKEVAQIYVLTHDAPLPKRLGVTDDQGHAGACLKKLLLFPNAVLAEHLTVIARVNDDPVVQILAHVLERLGDPAVVVVDRLDHAVV